MTEHKDMQDPAQFNELKYRWLELKLLSADTPQKELEDICMTLAHLPTKRARELLNRFQESDRATEVTFLQCAVEECKFHYLCPDNETERRDFIALKLYYKNEDRMVELMGEQSVNEFHLEEMQIELDAVKSLVQEKMTEADKFDLEIRISVLKDLMTIEESALREKVADMEMLERINQAIIEGVTTEKYKDLQNSDVSEIVFDGEEF